MRILTVFLLTLCACAAGFGNRVQAPVVSFQEKIASNADFPARLTVEKFEDKRPMPQLVTINGRDVIADEGIGLAVQQGFEQALKEAGVRLALFNAAKISGNIIEWQAIVGPKFPASSIVAKAAIQLEAYSKEGKKVFNRKYFGEVEGKHPIMTENRIRDLLGVAMGHAINTAANDRDLQRALK